MIDQRPLELIQIKTKSSIWEEEQGQYCFSWPPKVSRTCDISSDHPGASSTKDMEPFSRN